MRGIKVLLALWEKNLAKIKSKTTKNLLYSLAKLERERERVEKVLKKKFESVKTLFLKNWIHDLRLIEKQV